MIECINIITNVLDILGGMFHVSDSDVFADCTFASNIQANRPLFCVTNSGDLTDTTASVRSVNSQLMYMNSYDGLLTIADCLFDGNQRYEGLICIQDGNLWNNKQFECVGDTSCVTMTRITYCM
eukprot:887400_1